MDGKFVRRRLRMGLALCLVCASYSGAQSVAVGGRPEAARLATVSVDVVNAPLSDVLKMIARHAGLRTSWNTRLINAVPRVSLHIWNVPADEAFAKALAGTGLRADISASMVTVVTDATLVQVAQGHITGLVIDAATKRPLRGAMVTLDASTTGVRSGDDGTFHMLQVSPGTHTVRVRLLGYAKASTPVTVVEGQATSVTVALERSVSALDQVVVTGTVVQTALKAIPNAITVITAKELEQRGITHIDQLFRGDVPGLFAMNQGSESPLDRVAMYSRGATTLQYYTRTYDETFNTNAIKTYVDGVELADPSYLSQIDPKSIERIEILTGPQASTIYGSNAINGVMQIFTKRGARGNNRPVLNIGLLTGLVQSNFAPTLTPQHDVSFQGSGSEAHLSYTAGGSWNYQGAWTPSKQTAKLGGFGGVRLTHGPWSADASLRLSVTQNRQMGLSEQKTIDFIEQGHYQNYSTSYNQNRDHVARGQTLGVTLGYTPFSWWSHELIVGADVSETEIRDASAYYRGPSDTASWLNTSAIRRSSLRYATTAQIPVASRVSMGVTLGTDGWRTQTDALSLRSVSLVGTLADIYGSPSVFRQPDHNTGAFVQSQLAVNDALFVTVGLRAEWNPSYGSDAEPSLAPRYGAAYTHDLDTRWGTLTAKLRASVGRSTRPPAANLKVAIPIDPYYATDYGNFDSQLANSHLGPESQQGGEGGLELYFGTRGSLIVTRYNQTVDRLILNPYVDSVRSLTPYPSTWYSSLDADGYGFYPQYENLNGASIRNQGWELQGTLNVGPFTTKGTYSWTKSRVIGVSEIYRALVTDPQYQPGAMFSFLPEHTWALETTYGRGGTAVTASLTGTGQYFQGHKDALFDDGINSMIRLTQDQLRLDDLRANYPVSGYVMADINASHRVTSAVDGVLQIVNVTNCYRNDYGSFAASLGRQTKMGFRIRL